MCEGTRDDGSEIAPNDPQWAQLNATAQKAKSSPVAWLEQRQLYGDLADCPRFATSFSRWLNMMYHDGMNAALLTYLKGA
jgi:mannitol 2-dehydrogenase